MILILYTHKVKFYPPFYDFQKRSKVNVKRRGPVAQWITRLPTEQKIAGSIPAWIGIFAKFNYYLNRKLCSFANFICYAKIKLTK